MNFKLRSYQQDAVNKMLWDMGNEGNSIVCIAQGGGKSLIIADFAHKLGKPVLVLCPNKEILEQNVAKMRQYVDEEEIGLYSASVGSKTVSTITFGTVQSMYKDPAVFEAFDVVLMDECDLHNVKHVGMTTKLFKGAGIKKVFGFTGTPYRQDVYYKKWGNQNWQRTAVTTTKMINRFVQYFWARMLVVVNTVDLLEQGYLTPLVYHEQELVSHRSIPRNKSRSDFDMEKFDKMTEKYLLGLAMKISEIPHKSKLVFCSSIKQAEKLQKLVDNSVVVTGKTPKKKRGEYVEKFRSGEIEAVFNVGVFTVGFDFPGLESIVLLRPTRSLRLHSQILGRVARKSEGKDFGHVYDFVGNIKNMGKLEKIKVVKLDGQWNVVSDSIPDGFHNKELYEYQMSR